MLSKKEMEEGVAIVEGKVKKYRPGCVCLVGKGIWDAVERVWRREGRWGRRGGEAARTKIPGKGEFQYGWQEAWMGAGKEWEGARVFVATSSSGLAAGISWEEKVRIWKVLGAFVEERREARGEEGIGGGEAAEEDGAGLEVPLGGTKDAMIENGGDEE